MNRDEVLRSSFFLYDFLTEKDKDNFEKIWRGMVTSAPKPKTVADFPMIDGVANVELKQEAVVFRKKSRDYTDCQKQLFQECIDVSKEIE